MAVLDAIVEQRIQEAVRVISRQTVVRATYLFGSFAEGRDRRDSDIDLAVFVEGLDGGGLRRRARTTAQVQKEVGEELEAHLFRAEDMEDPPPASFAEYIMRHGTLVWRPA